MSENIQNFSAAVIKRQRIISVAAISIISFLGLEALVYVNNLYQPRIYIYLSIFVYLFLAVWLHFLFDLHFKETPDYAVSFLKAMKRRFAHFMSAAYFRHFQNYMVLPAILYWASVIMIGINFGHLPLQQFVAIVTALCLIASYSLFKEIFHSKFAPVRDAHFHVLVYIKVYAAWLMYAASLGVVWYYCFSPYVFYLSVFLTTFLLFYQAMFQTAQLSFDHALSAVVFSLFLAGLAYFVYGLWNVNYFSAGIFLAAAYNFLWHMFFALNKKMLTRNFFMQQALIFAIIIVMVFSVTNFSARIGGC